jgi:hypothetical protein
MRGHRLQVVTAKPAAAAHRVLAQFGITRFFVAVHDRRPLIEAATRRISSLPRSG